MKPEHKFAMGLNALLSGFMALLLLEENAILGGLFILGAIAWGVLLGTEL